jgi:hypothetical protein
MLDRIGALGDRMLSALVPRAEASAATPRNCYREACSRTNDRQCCLYTIVVRGFPHHYWHCGACNLR